MSTEASGSDDRENWSVLSREEEAVLGVVGDAIERIHQCGWEPSFEALCLLLGEAGVMTDGSGDGPGIFRLGGAVFRLRLDPADSAAVDVLFEEGSS